MGLTRRVFVSMPADRWLTEAQNDLKWGIVRRVEKLGLTPEIFEDPTGRDSRAGGSPWSAEAADDIAKRCVGAVLVGLPRWTFYDGEGQVRLPTEFCHYEGALARTVGLPTLVLAEKSLFRRVVFDTRFANVADIPDDANRSWLRKRAFTVPFGYWRKEIERRRDVFLGYCGSASEVADGLLSYLEGDVGATVLDWQRDFRHARSILQEIEEARLRCTTGVFLFTKDDRFAGRGSAHVAAPRDNVVFEAGYFASAKGKDRVLIVREKGTKLPADLGGDIYAPLKDRNDLSEVQTALGRFLSHL